MNYLLLLSLFSSLNFVSTLRNFRYDLLNMTRLKFSVSHWDVDLEPFAVRPHTNDNAGKRHIPGSVGALANYSQESDGTTLCVFKSEVDHPHENRFVCVYGAECCESDGCCFTPNPGATLKAVTLMMLSLLGCILLVSLCLVLKVKTERDIDNQHHTDRLLSNRGVSFELVSLPGRHILAHPLSSSE